MLDPRYKLKYLKVKYTEHYGEELAENLVKKVIDALNEMIDDYRNLNEDESKEDDFSSTVLKKNDDFFDGSDTYVDDFFVELEKEQEVAALEELDRYLEDKLEKNRIDFDLLNLWKVNEVRYPSLANVARDVFAIQASTVASESTFSTGGRTLDKFRSSLTPITAEVLICLQDWLRSSNKLIEIEELVQDLDDNESG